MPSILSGFSLGSYEILDRLGRGGMADVYLARDKARDGECPIVLRIVEYSLADDDVLAAERLGADLHRQLAAVDRRVPAIYDHGELDDCCFFVAMEYVEGEDLDARLRRGPLPWREACRVAREVLDLLDTAHHLATDVGGEGRGGVVHGDVKPRNIRLQPDGRVRLLDFGIAKALSLTRRATHNVFASSAYAAPERLATGAVDAGADLWAVGVILYEMIAGRSPFAAATTERIERQVLARRPPPPLPENAAPSALVRVLQRALAPAPADRHPTAAAFRDDLDAVLDGGDPVPVDAVPPSARAAAGRAADSAAPAAPDAGGATRRTVGPVGTRGNGAAVGGETHRTVRPAAGGETRRTQTAESEAPAPLPALLESEPPRPPAATATNEPATRSDSSPAPSAAPDRPARSPGAWWGAVRRGVGRVVAGFVIVASLGLVVLEAGVWNGARSLRQDLQADEIDAEAAWARYEQLDALSFTNAGLIGVRGPLKRFLLEDADDVIADYRDHDEMTVWEGRWRAARDHLLLARELDASDNDIEARLHYVEGHLARIAGRHRDAVRAFEAASDQWSRWPDPYLGLANTYLYGLRDYAAAEEALLALQARDYPFGKREWAVLADASYFRGLDRIEDCGGENERACLDEAAELFRTAADRYERVIPMGRSVENRRDALQQLEAIEDRKAALRRDAWYDRLRRFRLWD